MIQVERLPTTNGYKIFIKENSVDIIVAKIIKLSRWMTIQKD